MLVDDSIVRGTTSQKIVQMVRDAGAREVHMRIASPPTMSSCFYGVDTPEKAKLLASRMSVEEMADFIRVDCLAFLSIDGLYRAVGEPGRNNECPQFCDACFTGDYPTRLTDHDWVGNVRTLSLLSTTDNGFMTDLDGPDRRRHRRIARHRLFHRQGAGRGRRPRRSPWRGPWAASRNWTTR